MATSWHLCDQPSLVVCGLCVEQGQLGVRVCAVALADVAFERPSLLAAKVPTWVSSHGQSESEGLSNGASTVQ